MEQVHEGLVMILLGTLHFLLLIVVYHLIQIIVRITFLVLGDVPTDDINGSIKTAEEHFSINFMKAKTTFCLSLHYICDSGYLFVNGKKSASLKPIKKI